MSCKIKMLIAFIVGIVLTVGIPLCILWSGAMNWCASKKPGALETWVANMALDKSMSARAPKQQNPFGQDQKAIEVGLDHYSENCLVCHGAPGVKQSEISKGLNPGAPALEEPDSQSMTDGQFFWIIKNGVRMTGMPAFGKTHTDDEIWKIVAFVRQLPKLTPEEKQKLQSAARGQ